MTDDHTVTNTLEDPSEFDVLIKLRANEPHLTLAGRDPFAPILVREWAKMEREFVQANITDPAEKKRRLRKATDAESISWNMDSYRKGETEKATETEGTRPSYTSHELSPEAEKRDKELRARVLAARHLSEAAAQVQSAFEMLAEIEMITPTHLETLRDQLTEACRQAAPARISK